MSKKRNKMICCAAACMMAGSILITGCSSNQNVKEHTQSTEVTTAAKTDTDTDVQSETDTEIEKNASDKISGVAERLHIPSSVDMNIDTGNSGLKEICIKDDEIEVPYRDTVYTQEYKKLKCDAEYKKKIAEKLFDKQDGIYACEEVVLDKDDIPSKEEVEKVFATEYVEPTYEEMQFMGKKDGNIYLLTFFDDYQDFDNGLDYVRISDDLWSEDMPEGTTHAYMVGVGNKYSETADMNWLDKTEEEIRDYVYQFPALIDADTTCTEVEDAKRIYLSDTREADSVLDGAMVICQLAIDGQPIYQPNIFLLDTNIQKDNPYFEMPLQFRMMIDSYGLESMSVQYDIEPSGAPVREDNLLTWEAVMDIANEKIPEYYEENKTSYDKICFDDVRLTYFRQWTDETGQNFKVIPVYVFAEQLEREGGKEHNMPTQLIMINAIDGSLVNPAQDSSAWESEKRKEEEAQ